MARFARFGHRDTKNAPHLKRGIDASGRYLPIEDCTTVEWIAIESKAFEDPVR